MPARLIINADDFGLTRGINRAVQELYQAGALTSATLMANGPAFDDAAAIARANPGLGVGCHIVLTDGAPLSHPHDIPTLLGADGKNFRPSLTDFLFAAVCGRINPDEIAREALAQIQRLQRAGIDVTHLDTHKHVHFLPSVANPLLYVAVRCSIGAIRNPFEEPWSLALSHSDLVRRLQVRLMHPLRKRFQALTPIREGRVLTTDGTIGISATGRLDAATLRSVILAMPEGIWELVCHPGYNDRDLDAITTRLRASREIESAALRSTFGANSLHPSSLELIQYGSLGPFGVLRGLGQFQPDTGHEKLF